MLRILRPQLVTSRSRENAMIRSVLSSFTFAVLMICLTTLLTIIIADGYWKGNWTFLRVEKDFYFKSQHLSLREDFEFDADMPFEKIIDYLKWSNKSSCSLSRDFGGMTSSRKLYRGLDGQKAICLDPKEIAPPPDGCIVYLFDSKDEWSFGEAMAAYGCQVFAFNPRIDDGIRDNIRQPNLHFFHLRLGSKSFDVWAGETKRPTITLADLYQQMSIWHGKEAIIDYLNLDVDWAEWHILPHIIKSGMMDKVRQLAVKIHLPYSAPFFQRGQRLAQFTRLANILHEVENYGMIRFHSKPDLFFQGTIPALNFSGPLAYDMAWYNKRFL